MSGPETYEVFAVKYGTLQERQRRHNFIQTDPHDGQMPLDYYVWAIVNENRTIVVDTGFDHAEGERRGREILRLPREGLAMLDIDASQVEDVIVTHLHYDHAGTLDDFPQARFHIQDDELIYTTGRHMCHAPFGHAYSAEHVCTMVRRVFDGRVAFHDGDNEIAPGISVHRIGGHTMGLQCVRVLTKRGWVVLASDASHFYENMEAVSPFPIVFNVAEMVEGYEKMRRLAESPQHIIPGHDPLVMQRYATPKADLADVVVRLDVAPNG
ncbi:MAG: N-acyl homoserine lactonase family protein [Alphaproteobacteria bacterium]|nr:N-acyl homoserine lactonase family protein [Alphaproteobacteria bacterium]